MIDLGLVLLIAAKLGIASIMVVKHITKVIDALMRHQNELQADAALKADANKNILQAQLEELKKELLILKEARSIEEFKQKTEK